MNEIKGKFKITIRSSIVGIDYREYLSPEFVIKDKETVDFDSKAYRNLFNNLGMKEKSAQDSHYNDLLLCIYPHVREFFTENRSLIENCKSGMGLVRDIDLHIFIQLEGYNHIPSYTPALFANINKDDSRCVIYPPFEKQAVERSIPDEKDSISEKENKVEEKEYKYPLICYGILYLMLAGVLVGLIRTIYYLIIN